MSDNSHFVHNTFEAEEALRRAAQEGPGASQFISNTFEADEALRRAAQEDVCPIEIMANTSEAEEVLRRATQEGGSQIMGGTLRSRRGPSSSGSGQCGFATWGERAGRR